MEPERSELEVLGLQVLGLQVLGLQVLGLQVPGLQVPGMEPRSRLRLIAQSVGQGWWVPWPHLPPVGLERELESGWEPGFRLLGAAVVSRSRLSPVARLVGQGWGMPWLEMPWWEMPPVGCWAWPELLELPDRPHVGLRVLGLA